MVDDDERQQKDFRREFKIWKDIMNVITTAIKDMKQRWNKEIENLSRSFEERLLQVEYYSDEKSPSTVVNEMMENAVEDEERLKLHLLDAQVRRNITKD